jgi:hypothetical protein
MEIAVAGLELWDLPRDSKVGRSSTARMAGLARFRIGVAQG